MSGLPVPDAAGTCLITGASAGIGEAIARELASRGYGLTLTARREDRLRRLAAELERSHGIRVEVLPADLSDPTSWDALPEMLADLDLRVDVLVNNAGLGSSGSFIDLPSGHELAQVRVMCEAIVALSSAFVPPMVERGSGAVLIMSSTTGFQPAARYATYGAAKAFSLSFGQSLHAELRNTGITVTTVAPGPVRTDFFATNDVNAVRLPRGMWTTPERVARAAIDGLAHHKRMVIPGLGMRALMASSRISPPAIQLAVMDLLVPKQTPRAS